VNTFYDRNFTSGFLQTLNWMPSSPGMSWKMFIEKCLPLFVRTHKLRRESSWNRDRNAEVTAGPLFVFMGNRCRYFEKTSITDRMYPYDSFYFRGIAWLIYHIHKYPWGSRQCRDCVTTSSWQVYASYRLLDILARLWHQTCFSSVMLQAVYLKPKKLSVFQDFNFMPWRPS